MRRLLDWLLAGGVLAARSRAHHQPATPGDGNVPLERPQPVAPAAPPSPRAELVVVGLLVAATLAALGFVAVYAIDRIGHQTQFLGLTLGAAFLLLAAACAVGSRHLVVNEEHEESYPEPRGNPREQEAVVDILHEGTSRLTRKRLVAVVAGGAGAALGLALVVPAASLGPLLDWNQLVQTPWRRGRRLVDESGRPLRADAVEVGAFYTAFPEGAEREDVNAPVIVIRLPVPSLQLPADRKDWAPQGILAYSKICTHAGCAISLYRSPLYPPTEPKPALVCPCHYSTFDPATGGDVLFGPAGRPLPQLPLTIGRDGTLRAGGTFSQAPGPSWWSIRTRKPTT